MAKIKYERYDRVRSDSYQHRILETCTFGADDITNMIGSTSYKDNVPRSEEHIDAIDEALDLIDSRIFKRIWEIIDSYLTDCQREVIHGLAQGETQVALAKKLNKNQSNITKSLNGNSQYIYKDGKRVRQDYGGSIIKLKLIQENDTILQSLYKQRNYLLEYQDPTIANVNISSIHTNERRIVELSNIYKGSSAAKNIATKLDLPVKYCTYVRNAFGFKEEPPPKDPPKERKKRNRKKVDKIKIRQEYLAGATAEELSVKYNRAYNTVLKDLSGIPGIHKKK